MKRSRWTWQRPVVACGGLVRAPERHGASSCAGHRPTAATPMRATTGNVERRRRVASGATRPGRSRGQPSPALDGVGVARPGPARCRQGDAVSASHRRRRPCRSAAARPRAIRSRCRRHHSARGWLEVGDGSDLFSGLDHDQASPSNTEWWPRTGLTTKRDPRAGARPGHRRAVMHPASSRRPGSRRGQQPGRHTDSMIGAAPVAPASRPQASRAMLPTRVTSARQAVTPARCERAPAARAERSARGRLVRRLLARSPPNEVDRAPAVLSSRSSPAPLVCMGRRSWREHAGRVGAASLPARRAARPDHTARGHELRILRGRR